MSSIGDLSKFVEPISKLVDALRATVGVAYEPLQIRLVAKAEAAAALTRAKGEAAAALIKAEGDAKVEAFERRVQARISATEARRQRNIDSIVGGAVEALPAAPVPDSPVDPDWVAEFFNQSQDVSNETMQSLWSRILAGEVAAPGSFSLRTLQTVRMLTKPDAELFALICRLAITLDAVDGPLPILIDNGDFYNKHELWPQRRLHLKALGLVQDGLSIKPEVEAPALEFAYGGKRYEIRDPLLGSKSTLTMGISIQSFTMVGRELLPLVAAEPMPGYIEAIAATAKDYRYDLVEL
jgi:hypothetical protein